MPAMFLSCCVLRWFSYVLCVLVFFHWPYSSASTAAQGWLGAISSVYDAEISSAMRFQYMGRVFLLHELGLACILPVEKFCCGELL